MNSCAREKKSGLLFFPLPLLFLLYLLVLFFSYTEVHTIKKLKALEIDNPVSGILGFQLFSYDYGIVIIRVKDQKNVSIGTPILF